MNIEMKDKLLFVGLVFALLLNITPLFSKDLKLLQNITGDYAMQNVMERNCLSLNGEWDVMVDPSMLGEKKKWWKIRTPKNNHDFLELSMKVIIVLKYPVIGIISILSFSITGVICGINTISHTK